MRVPAICDSCGAIFASGIEVENAYSTTFANCGAGPCPACGKMGHIPDGVYNFIGNTIELLSGPTRQILKAIYRIIKDGAHFRDLGEECLALKNKSKKVQRLKKQAQMLGFELVPPEQRSILY